jgi:HlyD family secretion protein
MKAVNIFSKRTTWYVGLILLLLAAVGYGIYSAWQTQQEALAASRISPYETATVSRGNIVVGANGTGTVISNIVEDLSFSAAGVIAQLNVQPGDRVTKGQTMAALDDIGQLKTAVQTAQLNLQNAQQTLHDLQAYPDKTIAQAQSTLFSAQKTQAIAQFNLIAKGQQRCSDELTLQYYYATLHDQHYVNYYGGLLGDMANNGFGKDFLLKNLNYSQKILNRDTSNYTYCQGYTQDEVNASQANLKMADATVTQAQAALKDITAANGVDPVQLAIDKAKVQQAQLQLTTAQQNLDGAILTAPIDGTILSVAGNVGDTVGAVGTTKSVNGIANTTISQSSNASTASITAGTTAFITIADLTHPIIDTSIDQTDYQNFKEGCSANVTFDSLPGKVFTGTVTLVKPQLATTNGFQSIKGWVDLDAKAQTLLSKPLPLGSSAAVDVICQQAQNVLMVPSETLKNVNGSQADVYVLNAAGQPEKRSVTLGLSNGIFTEVKSGLSVGDKVITKGAPAQ